MEAGASVNAVNNGGFTPLISRLHRRQRVSLLLGKGATSRLAPKRDGARWRGGRCLSALQRVCPVAPERRRGDQ
jgi:hypothetical protein